MPGAGDYFAKNTLSYLAGQAQEPALPSLFMALFTTAPTSDAGSGGTEVSGTGYARVQCAGPLAITGSTSTSSTTFTLSANAPAWLAALSATSGTTGGGGVTVWSSAGVFIGTIAAGGANTASTTITLTANAAAVASGTLSFSAFSAPAASTGNPEPNTLPATITNGAVVNFAQAGAGGWGTALAFAFYDSINSGGSNNFLYWDGLGNYKWQAFTSSSASPAIFTVDNSGDAYANATSVIVTQKYGSTLPTLSAGSFSGTLTTLNLSTNTFQLETSTPTVLNASTTGGGLIRQIQQQQIPANVTASIAAGQLVVSLA